MTTDKLQLWIAPEADRFFLVPPRHAFPEGETRVVSLKGVVRLIDIEATREFEVPLAIAEYRIVKWQNAFVDEITRLNHFIFSGGQEAVSAPIQYASVDAFNAAMDRMNALPTTHRAELNAIIERIDARIGWAEALQRAIPALALPDLGAMRRLVSETGAFLVAMDRAANDAIPVEPEAVARFVSALAEHVEQLGQLPATPEAAHT